MCSNTTERADNECPECGQKGSPYPHLEDEYECHGCLIAFNADGEVTLRG